MPRLFRVEPRQAVASAFEIGIHNATLAIVIAQTVIGSVEMSLPAAVYGVLMFFVALAFGFIIRGRVKEPRAEVARLCAARSRIRAPEYGRACNFAQRKAHPCPGNEKSPGRTGAFTWCARGDLNPHALASTGT